MADLRLTIGDHDSSHTVRVGERLFVELEALPGAGFQWSVEVHDEALVDQATHYLERGGNQIGGGSLQQFEFVAARPGEVDLRFKYQRRWEGDASTKKVFHVQVRVGEAPLG